MENEVISLNQDDVLSTSASLLMFQCTFKVSEYITMILTRLESENLFEDGLECQLLRPGDYWRKGRIKLHLEFLMETSNHGSKTELVTTEVGSISHLSTDPLPNLEEKANNVGMWS